MSSDKLHSKESAQEKGQSTVRNLQHWATNDHLPYICQAMAGAWLHRRFDLHVGLSCCIAFTLNKGVLAQVYQQGWL